MNLKIIMINVALVVCIAITGTSFSNAGLPALQKANAAAQTITTCSAQHCIYANTALSTSLS